MTQREIADELSTSLKRVQTAMRRFGVRPRVATKRDQRGEKNATWKGDAATYEAFHKRVEVARGTPKACSECGADDPNQFYDWANLTGNYADVEDYARMCRSCHRRYDNERRRGGDASCP